MQKNSTKYLITSIQKYQGHEGHLGGSVKCLTSAQVMIPRLVSSSPKSGSVPTAQSLEPASDSVCLSLSLHGSHSCLSLSQK